MDSTEDWRSLLNFKYAEPEYQALFSGEKKPIPPPPPFPPSSGSVKKTSVDGTSVRSEYTKVEDVLDGRPLFEQFPAIRFPPLPQPLIPDPMIAERFSFDLDGLLAGTGHSEGDKEIVASVQFLQAVMGGLVGKSVELRNSIIEHAAYTFQLQQPISQDDVDYIQATIFPNYVSMKDELQEVADELALLKPWKVRHLFVEELDEDALIEAAGGVANHSAIIHLLAQSYGAGHRFMALERAIVQAGQALQDETTRSIIAVSQLHTYTAAIVRYPPGPYPKASGVEVRWDGLNELQAKVAARRSALSRDFERFMTSRRLPVTNALFAYLQHPQEYGHVLSVSRYRFGPGEFAAALDWLEVQDERALAAARAAADAGNRGPDVDDPTDSVLRRVEVIALQHCALSDRDAHRLAQALPRLTRLGVLNLSHNALSQSAMASLATVVMQHPQCLRALRLLLLDDNRLNSDGAFHLAQVLHPHCPRLLKLSLSGNPIGDKGAVRVLQTLLNPQRRAFAHLPPLQAAGHRDKATRRRRGAAVEDGDEEVEEDEEVLVTLDAPARRASQAPQTVGRVKTADGARFRGSVLFGDAFNENLAHVSSGANGGEEVQEAVQSQRRYPLQSYLCDFFAPTLVLETLRSLLAAAEYDVQHGGDGRGTLRQHHYLFQQTRSPSAQTAPGGDAARAAIDYSWVNDPDRDEFLVDAPSDYSDADSDAEDRRRIALAVARVQKLRGVVAAAPLPGDDASQTDGAEAGYRAVPRRTLARIEARVQRARHRRRRLAQLSFRERLVLREKRALGVHKTRRALREQLDAVGDSDEDEDEELLEESSEEEEADYRESDEEDVGDDDGFDGGFQQPTAAEAAAIDSDEERTQVLAYAARPPVAARRGSQASQVSAAARSAKPRPVLTTTALLLRARQSRVFEKYPRLVQRVLRLRLRLVAVALFLSLRRRTQLPSLAALSLARCRLTAAVLPTLTVALREDNCLLALDVSDNAGLLAKQEDCSLLASGLRYTLDMKRDPLNYHVPHPSRRVPRKPREESAAVAIVSGSSTESQFFVASLQQLALNGVGLTDAGLVALAPAWSVAGSSLARVELRGNRFGPTAANVLANLCQRAHFFLGSAAIVSLPSRAVGIVGGGDLQKVKPPVFSAEDDDFHRDEGFLADDALWDAPVDRKAPRKGDASADAALKPARRSRRQRRESLALGGGAGAVSAMRLVDEDEDSMDSFRDGDSLTEDDSDLGDLDDLAGETGESGEDGDGFDYDDDFDDN